MFQHSATCLWANILQCIYVYPIQPSTFHIVAANLCAIASFSVRVPRFNRIQIWHWTWWYCNINFECFWVVWILGYFDWSTMNRAQFFRTPMRENASETNKPIDNLVKWIHSQQELDEIHCVQFTWISLCSSHSVLFHSLLLLFITNGVDLLT